MYYINNVCFQKFQLFHTNHLTVHSIQFNYKNYFWTSLIKWFAEYSKLTHSFNQHTITPKEDCYDSQYHFLCLSATLLSTCFYLSSYSFLGIVFLKFIWPPKIYYMYYMLMFCRRKERFWDLLYQYKIPISHCNCVNTLSLNLDSIVTCFNCYSSVKKNLL